MRKIIISFPLWLKNSVQLPIMNPLAWNQATNVKKFLFCLISFVEYEIKFHYIYIFSICICPLTISFRHMSVNTGWTVFTTHYHLYVPPHTPSSSLSLLYKFLSYFHDSASPRQLIFLTQWFYLGLLLLTWVRGYLLQTYPKLYNKRKITQSPLFQQPLTANSFSSRNRASWAPPIAMMECWQAWFVYMKTI